MAPHQYRFPRLGLAMYLGLVIAGVGCGSTTPHQAGRKPAVSGIYDFWYGEHVDPHLQFLQAIASREDVTPGARNIWSDMIFGEDDGRETAIVKPYGLALKDGRLYVCDVTKNQLLVLDFAKKQMRILGATGFTTLANPVDVHIADDGVIYVADNERAAVFVFGTDEKFQRVIGHEDFSPVGLATSGDRLYVCNKDSQLVEIFNRFTGEMLGTIGTIGDFFFNFRVTIVIYTDGEGNVYVMDMMRCRLQKFSPQGELLAAVGDAADAAGSFVRPKQIAVDSDGIVYVVDATFQNVQMFDSQFRLLMHFGASGDFAGSMNLPAGICVDDGSMAYFADELHPGFAAKRIVLVGNQFGPAKVNAYAMGERAEGWSISELTANAAEIEAGLGQNPRTANLQDAGDEAEPLPEPEDGGEQPGGGAGGGAGGR